ncbi:MAG TPA: HAMP domain-containing protein [Thermodesulfobacteriota bacterium]|nr:HAMP domain-containing protein [Thermodesulfobacteriota bacterium]
MTAMRGTEKSAPAASAPKKKKSGLLGLRGKMFVLFFLIPITLIIAASLLYIWQLNTLSSGLAKGSTETIIKMTEEVVADRAREVASQCKVYLITHPDLKKAFFNYDLKFKRIVVQKIGVTGHTSLYETPGADGVWRTWAHLDPNVIGADMTALKESFGESFPAFWKICTGGKDGKELKESKGYYKWRDSKGTLRDTFLITVPVEGTPYVLSATAYPDEFTEPVKFMQEGAAMFALQTRNIVIGILGGTLILIGFIVAFYAYRLTAKIRYLTEITDRISVGDLDAEITGIKSRDEIGELANAIGRMQESIRLAIKRLRERK